MAIALKYVFALYPSRTNYTSPQPHAGHLDAIKAAPEKKGATFIFLSKVHTAAKTKVGGGSFQQRI